MDWICRYSLNKYNQLLKKMEALYGMTTEDFVRENRDQTLGANKYFQQWYDIYLAGEKCSLRKKELEGFLERLRCPKERT
ncbi:MAG: hypothetical protein ACUVS3_11685 [Thermodesulfobacteriota bacterium]